MADSAVETRVELGLGGAHLPSVTCAGAMFKTVRGIELYSNDLTLMIKFNGYNFNDNHIIVIILLYFYHTANHSPRPFPGGSLKPSPSPQSLNYN